MPVMIVAASHVGFAETRARHAYSIVDFACHGKLVLKLPGL